MKPLGFGRADILVNYDLGPVKEIAELRLPNNKIIRTVQREAIVKTHDSFFGQIRVADLQEAGLTLIDVVEWNVSGLCALVDEQGVALAESAASNILPADSDVEALHEQRAEC